MKETKQCPKCKSHDIMTIPGSVGSYGGGNHIPIGNKISQAILVTRFVCMSCGYSEEWIVKPEDIQKLKKEYY